MKFNRMCKNRYKEQGIKKEGNIGNKGIRVYKVTYTVNLYSLTDTGICKLIKFSKIDITQWSDIIVQICNYKTKIRQR